MTLYLHFAKHGKWLGGRMTFAVAVLEHHFLANDPRELMRQIGFDKEISVHTQWFNAPPNDTTKRWLVVSFESQDFSGGLSDMNTLNLKILGLSDFQIKNTLLLINGLRAEGELQRLSRKMKDGIDNAIDLLKSGRGRKPSRKEMTVRRILEASIQF